MKVDLFYDGQILKWSDKGLAFKATSGMQGHQMPGEQCTPDAGPIPEGLYKVFIADQGIAKDDGRGICAIAPSWGIQEIPRGVKAGVCEPYWANRGKNRARMEPADSKTKNQCAPLTRGGFYLRDSVKGFSHGCIEVDTKLFKYLREYHSLSKKQSIVLKVQYLTGRTTNGGTKI